MRLADFVISAAVIAGLSAPAMAQEGSGQPSPAPAPATNAAAGQPLNLGCGTPPTCDSGNHWVASAFVGTNFGTGFSGTDSNPLGIPTDNTTSSINFGGQVAYLWSGWVGVEGLAEFSPSFEIADVLLENKPDINTYMANGIVAGHLGEHHQYMPYLSGGVGAVQMRSTIFQFSPTDISDLTPIGTFSHTGSRFGWDLGAGAMGFVNRWGFRGDVRYYRASVANSIDLTDLGTGTTFTNAVLSGLAFWKANVGVAFRW